MSGGKLTPTREETTGLMFYMSVLAISRETMPIFSVIMDNLSMFVSSSSFVLQFEIVSSAPFSYQCMSCAPIL